jgi:ubiquinone/menaquinone biosynthesis C-methylase UbiE
MMCQTGEITFGLVEIVAGNEGEEGKGEGKIIALDSSKEMIESAQELCTDKLLVIYMTSQTSGP